MGVDGIAFCMMKRCCARAPGRNALTGLRHRYAGRCPGRAPMQVGMRCFRERAGPALVKEVVVPRILAPLRVGYLPTCADAFPDEHAAKVRCL